MITDTCLFCNLSVNRIVASDKLGIVIRDEFPVSPGHTLIILRRHVSSFFNVTSEERSSLLCLLDEAKLALDAEFQPSGYNIGFNEGISAGQTVPHLHIHLIPRYSGDQKDPRGGVRWVIPNKAKYWL